jgi:hypothetical protein
MADAVTICDDAPRLDLQRVRLELGLSTHPEKDAQLLRINLGFGAQGAAGDPKPQMFKPGKSRRTGETAGSLPDV